MEFQASPKRSRKRITSMPGAQEKLVVEQEESPLKNSVILERNPVDPNMEKLIDSKLLGVIK